MNNQLKLWACASCALPVVAWHAGGGPNDIEEHMKNTDEPILRLADAALRIRLTQLRQSDDDTAVAVATGFTLFLRQFERREGAA